MSRSTNGSRGRFRSVGMVFALALVLGAPQAVTAEALAKKTARHSQPARTSQSALDRTGTIAKPPIAPSPKSSAGPVESEAMPVPFYLPDVPRARMRACGESWRAKKMAGDVGDSDWRDFAIACLAADAASPVVK